jgi:hypothetical protein
MVCILKCQHLVIANVGTAVVPYAVFKRYSQGLALGYVAARLVEAMFVAIKIISLLTFVFTQREGAAGRDAALGEALSRSVIGRS